MLLEKFYCGASAKSTTWTAMPIGLPFLELQQTNCLRKCQSGTNALLSLSIFRRVITGLRSILIPYRTHLVKLQSGPSVVEMFGDFISKLQLPGKIETANQKERLWKRGGFGCLGDKGASSHLLSIGSAGEMWFLRVWCSSSHQIAHICTYLLYMSYPVVDHSVC